MFKFLVFWIVLLGLTSCGTSRQLERINKEHERILARCKLENEAAISAAIWQYVQSHPVKCPEINADSLCRSLGYAGETFTLTPENAPVEGGGKAGTGPKAIITKYLPGDRILVPFEDTRKIELLKEDLRFREDSFRAKLERLAGDFGYQQNKANLAEQKVNSMKSTNRFLWSWLIALILITLALGYFYFIKHKLK